MEKHDFFVDRGLRTDFEQLDLFQRNPYILRNTMATQCIDFERKSLVVAIAIATGAFLLGGCPGDRCLLLQVTGGLENSKGDAISSEKVVVFNVSYPCPPWNEEMVEYTELDMGECVRDFVTDSNGHFVFEVFNFEPVGVPLSILLDIIVHPSVEFAILFPERDVDGYAVRCPWEFGAYGEVSYKRIDAKTGRILSKTYRDSTGGLAPLIESRLLDANDPLDKLHVTIKLPEE